MTSVFKDPQWITSSILNTKGIWTGISFYNWSKENNYRLILLTTKSQKKYINYKFQSNDILLFGRESAGVTLQFTKALMNN